MRPSVLLWPSLALIGACSGDGAPPPTPDGGPPPIVSDAGTERDAAAPSDADVRPDPSDGGTVRDGGRPVDPMDAGSRPDAAGPVTHECAPTDGICTAWNEAITCADTPSGRRWSTTTCPSGGCYQGGCRVDQCSDECTLGATNGNRRCDLWDVDTDRWVGMDDGRLHDRARSFDKWVRRDTKSLFHDGIVSVRYTADDLRTVDSIYIGDTALHTGVYLAAEAYRLAETGAPRARSHVEELVETFHVWFNVSGDPGNLATIAVPAGDRNIRRWTDWDCDQFDRYCDVSYDGRRWDYVGDPSRDMYVGPLLGLVEAYDALGPHGEPTRALIREDLVVLAEEVVRLRTLPVRFVINGGALPRRNMDLRFFVPEAGDMEDGALRVSVDTGDIADSGDIRGGQEFLPNPAVLFRQLRTLSWVPDIPRASSAMMVPAIILAAAHVSEGQPAYASRRHALMDFYLNNPDEWGNFETWLEYAGRYSHTRECGERYFGLNIAFIPAYVWAKLEPDPTRKRRIIDEVLTAALWQAVEEHENSFFSFLYRHAGGQPAATRMDEARRQIEIFDAPPRRHRAVDLTRSSAYRSRESGCTDQVDHDDVVDVDDRPASYFAWHEHPWSLKDRGRTGQTYPGHDYLVGYWLGRAAGQIDEDSNGRCLRWR